jgi:hypothetical protein
VHIRRMSLWVQVCFFGQMELSRGHAAEENIKIGVSE